MATARVLATASRKFLQIAHPAVLDNDGVALTGSTLVTALQGQRWAPVSNKDKAKFVVIAYALVCLHRGDVATLAALKASFEGWEPRTLEPARLFVQAMHLPLEAWQDTPQQATNFYSRYAGAVKYLVATGEKPSVALSDTGSVNRWEELHRKGLRPAVAPAPTEAVAEFRIKRPGKKPLKWTSSDPHFIKSMIQSLRRRATKVEPTG